MLTYLEWNYNAIPYSLRIIREHLKHSHNLELFELFKYKGRRKKSK